MLVGVGYAPVVLFPVVVGERLGIGVAAQPELLDELLALLIVREPPERLPLFVRDDVVDVLVEPFLEGSGKLALQRRFALRPLAVRQTRSVRPDQAVAGGVLGRSRQRQPQRQQQANSPHTHYE
jgi:hypothetical protein